jgi:hypothetical protein
VSLFGRSVASAAVGPDGRRRSVLSPTESDSNSFFDFLSINRHTDFVLEPLPRIRHENLTPTYGMVLFVCYIIS